MFIYWYTQFGRETSPLVLSKVVCSHADSIIRIIGISLSLLTPTSELRVTEKLETLESSAWKGPGTLST